MSRKRATRDGEAVGNGSAALPPLRSGWCWAKVHEVGEVKLGRQRSPEHHHGLHMRPYLRVANVFEDRIDLSDVLEMNFTPEEYKTYKLLHGDILLNEGQSLEWVGRPAMYRDELPGACFQNTLVRFRPGPAVLPEFALLIFRHYLHSHRFQMIAKWTVNIAHLGAGRFADLEFPLPPMNEQARNVEKADELFTRLDAGCAMLERVHGNLRRYRFAVLEAAITGRLVPDSGPVKVMPLRDLIDGLGQGWSPNCEPERQPLQSEWAIIKTTAIQPMHYLGHEAKALPTRLEPRPELEIRIGDMLMTRKGRGGRAGVTCLVRRTRSRNMLCDTVYRFRCRESIIRPEYLEIALNAPSVLGEIYYKKTGNVNSGVNLTLTRMQEIRIKVPRLEDQDRIIEAVSRRLSIVDSTAQMVRSDQKRARHLRQGILERAFSGRLVPQDPNDEPADPQMKQTYHESHSSRDNGCHLDGDSRKKPASAQQMLFGSLASDG